MCDVVVIGAGIIGMLTARELHEAGYKVAILEQGEVARESSWAGGGILSPLYPWRYPAAVNHLAALSQARLEDVERRIPGLEDLFPLSPLQQGLLFQSLYERQSPAYFVQLSAALEGDLDPEILRDGFQIHGRGDVGVFLEFETVENEVIQAQVGMQHESS